MSTSSKTPILLQTKTNECGIACVGMIASYYGNKHDMPSLRRVLGPRLTPTSLSDLISYGRTLQLNGRVLRLSADLIMGLRTPCVLHWELNHFVVLVSIHRKYFIIHDPSKGKIKIDREDIRNKFTGYAIEFFPDFHFQKNDSRRRITIPQFASLITGWKHILLRTFALSLAFDIVAFVSQFFMQVLTDQVIGPHDEHLLPIAIIGFALIGFALSLIGFARTLIINRMFSDITYELGAKMYDRLVRLKFPFFQNREPGDILLRMASLSPLRDLTAMRPATALIDGVISLAIAPMLFWINPLIGFLSLGSLLIFGIFLFTRRAAIYDKTQLYLEQATAQQSHILETIRAIQGIKLAGKHDLVSTKWKIKSYETIETNNSIVKTNARFQLISELISKTDSMITISILSYQVMTSSMTIGQMFSIIFVRGLMVQRGINVVDVVSRLQNIKIHTERISEIFADDLEPSSNNTRHYSTSDKSTAALVISNLTFTYPGSTSPVLQNLNIEIPTGSIVAVTGRSGGGKTTLLRLCCGLLEADAGNISIFGKTLNADNLIWCREQISTVSQSDELLTGTISENISFMEPSYDNEKIWRAAKISGLYEDIANMAGGFDTVIGHDGCSISAGQRQRLLLARALYMDRPILLLDEPTANLDTHTELSIISSIARLDKTVIISTHRELVVDHCDIKIKLDEGKCSMSKIGMLKQH